MRNSLQKRNGEAMQRVVDLRVGDAHCSGKAMLPAREVTVGQGDVAQQANCRGKAVSENQAKRKRMHSTLNPVAAHLHMSNFVSENWYVGQVLAGKEHATLAQCRRLVDSSVLTDVFAPEYETMWKGTDGWRPVRRLLFPGYLFFITSNVEKLATQLSRVPNRVRMLGDEENSYMALSSAERDWFLSFIDQDRIVRMSEGFIENQQVCITRGPLMGMEGRISKVDRHKRCAFLEVNMFGRITTAKVGLEIVRKA